MTRSLHLFLSLGLLLVFGNSCRKKLSAETIAANQTVETAPMVLQPHYEKVGPMISGYYAGTPSLYPKTSKNYPLLISLHGGGQLGNGNADLPFVLNDGVPLILQQGKFPPNFHVGDKDFSFVVLAPQYNQYPSDLEISNFVDFARKKFRVDPARIYITGLSLGGIVASEMGGAYTSKFAAVVPMSGVSVANMDAFAKNIANGRLPYWIFHNDNDPKNHISEPTRFVAAINKFNPAIPPKFTVFRSDLHDAWTKAVDPGYKENNMNIYEWMLQYSK
jgi:predicted peptidase